VDGLAVARALRSAAGGSALGAVQRIAGPAGTNAFTIGAALPQDDDAIRRLLRESQFGNDVALSLEREPDSRLGASIEGDHHLSLVARHRSGAVAGIASRAVRRVFVNGTVTRIGYLGQLRIDPRFRTHRELLARGFDTINQMRQQDGVRLHLAAVVADNVPARRLLARRARGWPAFQPVDTLVSLAIPVGAGRRRRPRDIECRRGSLDDLDGIVGCLEEHARRSQFSPVWSRADLLSATRSRNLHLEDFTVAMRDDRVIGCVACWDQRPFKQAVVRGYSPRLARWRPLVNLLAPLTGTPYLPPVGATLDFAYLSHLAPGRGDPADPSVAIALVRAALAAAARRRLRYVVLGMSALHPLFHEVRRAFSHRAYESVLYAVVWPDDEALAAALDGRPSHPELAIL
jgi:hypothetical protein